MTELNSAGHQERTAAGRQHCRQLGFFVGHSTDFDQLLERSLRNAGSEVWDHSFVRPLSATVPPL